MVPNSTIGMVIGKGGESVEEMKQRSGSNILISKKAEQKVPERMITLVGEMRSNQIALDMILEKIQDDPNSGSCQNINYSGSSIIVWIVLIVLIFLIVFIVLIITIIAMLPR